MALPAFSHAAFDVNPGIADVDTETPPPELLTIVNTSTRVHMASLPPWTASPFPR